MAEGRWVLRYTVVCLGLPKYFATLVNLLEIEC